MWVLRITLTDYPIINVLIQPSSVISTNTRNQLQQFSDYRLLKSEDGSWNPAFELAAVKVAIA